MVLARTIAFESDGMIRVTGPFIDCREIVFASSSRVNVTWSGPLIVDSLASPRSPRAVTRPLIDEALTLPSTPSISIGPFMSSIDSSTAWRGTVKV